MELWACGFNAHGQISPLKRTDEAGVTQVSACRGDLWQFQKIAPGNEIKVLYASLVQTALLIDDQLYLIGFCGPFPSISESEALRPSQLTPVTLLATTLSLTSPFGDHNGFIGAVCSATGKLYTMSFTSPAQLHFNPLQYPGTTSSTPPLSALATASSGVTTAVFLASPEAKTIHLAIFPSLSQFHDWHADPSNPACTTHLKHHMLPGQLCKLVAGAVSFTLLTQDGNVYTWGDGRYTYTLGRKLQQGWDKPGLVETLGGLQVTDICSGGFLSGAITEAKDGYLWGSWSPEVPEDALLVGGAKSIKMLGFPEEDGPVHIYLPALPPANIHVSADGLTITTTKFASAEDDIIDLAIGRNHVLALTRTNRIWSAGIGNNGQLGTQTLNADRYVAYQDEEVQVFEPEWEQAQVDAGGETSLWDHLRVQGKAVVGVACGDLSSFAVVKSISE